MRIDYRILYPDDMDDSSRVSFGEMLRRHGQVLAPFDDKAGKCKFVCIASLDGTVVAIGAIKKKTGSDFLLGKADVPELGPKFDWELGYLYTDEQYRDQGIGSGVVRVLLDNYGDDNLMATTEVTGNPAMVAILESHAFRLFGHPWLAAPNDRHLGLFLRFR